MQCLLIPQLLLLNSVLKQCCTLLFHVNYLKHYYRHTVLLISNWCCQQQVLLVKDRLHEVLCTAVIEACGCTSNTLVD
jgi:hypothetical protein